MMDRVGKPILCAIQVGREICYTEVNEAFMGLQMAIMVVARRKCEIVVNVRELRDQATMMQVCHDVPHCNLWIQPCEMFSERQMCINQNTSTDPDKWSWVLRRAQRWSMDGLVAAMACAHANQTHIGL